MKMKKILFLMIIIITVSTTSYAQPSDWAKEGIDKATSYNIIPEALMSHYDEEITREEFSSLAVKLYEAVSYKELPTEVENIFTDTNNREVLIASQLGIVSGIGDNKFEPEAPITREQIAVMLYRTLESANIEVEKHPVFFTDSSSISNWAKDSIGFMNHHGVIEGVSGNRMDPKSLVTREQAMLMVSRAYENFVKVNYINLNGNKISLGDTQVEVEKLLGSPDRIDPSILDYNWHVYNSDYSNFIMVGIRKGIVEALYTNSKGFEVNGIKYGDNILDENNIIKKEVKEKLLKNKNQFIRPLLDVHNGNKVYGFTIHSGRGRDRALDYSFFEAIDGSTFTDIQSYYNLGYWEYLSDLKDKDFLRAQELMIFDASNAFRRNYGQEVLKLDDIATITARNHSQDMANKDYFSHTNLLGLSPKDRYENNKGSNSYSGENIAAGNMMASETFDQWVNSKGHRENILSSNHEYLGVGCGYSDSSTYNYYSTQLFTRERPWWRN